MTRTALVLIGLAGAATASAQTTAGPEACAALRQIRFPATALTIVATEWIPAGSTAGAGTPFSPPSGAILPAYCRLEGMLDRRTGADGRSYGIGFALALPAEWSGRFLFHGGSGLNGVLPPPIGDTAAGATPALARGFAVVSTDAGHRAPFTFDATFTTEQQASADFAYRAVERVTQIAKQIIERHYTRPPDRSYFTGCSTGGREAMLMAQRSPLEFDGVVAGAPAMRANISAFAGQWTAVQLNQAPALSATDKRLIIDAFVGRCDAADGLRDGMVFNPGACRFDPKVLACSAAKRDDCLDGAQADALVRAIAGVKDSRGRQVYPGFPIDTGVAATQGLPGWLNGGLQQTTATAFDVDRAMDAAAADAAALITNTAAWTNLNTFAARGGKLIFFHGVSDSTFSSHDTVDYVTRLAAANGGAAARQWARLFLSPGMGHCRGGDAALDTFDLLTAVVDWVERGIAPDQVPATGTAFPGRTRPLCAWPTYAHYTGGDPQATASFQCRD